MIRGWSECKHRNSDRRDGLGEQWRGQIARSVPLERKACWRYPLTLFSGESHAKKNDLNDGHDQCEDTANHLLARCWAAYFSVAAHADSLRSRVLKRLRRATKGIA